MLITFKNKEFIKSDLGSGIVYPVPVNERCSSLSLPDNFIHSAFERCHEYLNMLEKCYKKTDGARSFLIQFEFNFGVSDAEAPLFK